MVKLFMFENKFNLEKKQPSADMVNLDFYDLNIEDREI
jgi:hypothetical protein